MRIFSIFALLFLLSCKNDEVFINNFINKDKISLINVYQEPISETEVLSEFDDIFLKKYNFSKNVKIKKRVLKVSKINHRISNNRKEYTKLSLPVYSNDNKYCLLQIISFKQTMGYSNVIYFFKNNNNRWSIEDKFESKLLN
ncbi:hypothetical protein [Chryseobacterium camelliae]|uniref:hypothetical protein n=1 Tax=Chryseobacterium camelliae TaxID=1265445 RepID=UPI000C1CB170|nr:hypothetical protein [Chryseobacterium camelliae]